MKRILLFASLVLFNFQIIGTSDVGSLNTVANGGTGFGDGSPASSYWLTAIDPSFMIFMEIGLSPEMKQSKTLPMLYIEKEPGAQVSRRPFKAQPLGKSPVNVAIALDMSTLEAGSHVVSFQLFVDNTPAAETLESFKQLKEWQVSSRRLLPNQW